MVSYWIQRADFSTTEHGQVGEHEAVQAYQRHDWIAEVAQARRLEAAAAEHCAPGIGFVADADHFLHVCPDGNSAVVHYHFEGEHRVLGLFSSRRPRMVTVEGVPPGTVLELIRLFASGQAAAVRATLERVA
jgi:hypothetical protein